MTTKRPEDDIEVELGELLTIFRDRPID